MIWRVLASIRRLMLPFVSADEGRSATKVAAERGLCEAGARAFDMGENVSARNYNVNTASGYAPPSLPLSNLKSKSTYKTDT